MKHLLVLLLAGALFLALPQAQAQTHKPKPAFAGQTEAPAPRDPSAAPQLKQLARGLGAAWCITFLPDGGILITENNGTIRILHPDGVLSAPLDGVPDVKAVAAQGLHDVLLDPDFVHNRTLYLTYLAPPPGEKPGTWPNEYWYQKVWAQSLAERRRTDLGTEVIARAKLKPDNTGLTDVRVLAEGAERRIVLAPDGTLFVTGADRFRFYDSDLDGVEHDFADNPDIRRNFSGRVLRINRDGSIPVDNPWMSRATVPANTFAHGLRDPEGAAINPKTGELWVTDHGPQGGDEINIIRAGKDYGWPDVSYGVQYDANRTDGRKNVPVGSGKTSRADVEEPVYFWSTDIGPSGMMFYTGDEFPAWRDNLFVGALSGQALVRLVLDGNRVVAEEHLLKDLKRRIRDVRQGPDGAIYVLAGDTLQKLTAKH
jgi:glucose/arabinose dehydrogenase